MPKRSNEFQSLVAFIYEKISPAGGKVIESGMVLDKDAGVEREVDILIEQVIAGHSVKIAIECRPRGRKDSVEWIDCIIGKAKSLDVDKVVAISKSGFSEAAERKAKANNIDTISLKQAAEIDWSQYPIKPGIALMSGEHFVLKGVFYWQEGEFRDFLELGLESLVVIEGEKIGTIKDCFEGLFHQHFIPFCEKYIDDNRSKIFSSLEDSQKNLHIEKEIIIPDSFVEKDGVSIDISRTKMVAIGSRLVKILDSTHAPFQNKLVSQASFQEEEGDTVKFRMLQDPEAGQLHINWTKVESSNK